MISNLPASKVSVATRLWAQAELRMPLRRRDIRTFTIDDEVVFYDRRRQGVFLLNETAIWVWQRCDGLATICETAQAMSREYDVSLDTAQGHVEELVTLFSSSILLDLATGETE